ncbi:MAG: hypothetical protein JWL65_2204 [Gammaproteobacteria bacterium]|nr:hypothetical protein [Gammaproteobacteria bacterium]
MISRTVVVAITAFIFCALAGTALAGDPVGDWGGFLIERFHMIIHIEKLATGQYSASMRNVEMGRAYLPADKAVVTANHLQLSFAAADGAYEAQWDPAKRAWAGQWLRQGQPFPLNLSRVDPAAWRVFEVKRPQEDAIEQGPRPYREIAVQFQNRSAGITLAGTLTVPQGRYPFVAVVLIAGSGPMNRDEEGGGHRVFEVLADALSRRNIAVLRYDKRGVGKSTGDFAKATINDLVSDTSAALAYLQTRPEVDKHHVGLIGHSEGGTIAPMVAVNEPSVSFLVLMAGSAISNEKRTVSQQYLQALDGGASEAQAQQIRALTQHLFDAVRASSDDSDAVQRIHALLEKAETDRAITTAQAKSTAAVFTPALLREMLAEDPAASLRQIKVPVLALVGSIDHTVAATIYVPAAHEALSSNPHATVKELPGLNHMFQTATIGSGAEMATIQETISPVALQVIGDWVQEQTR